MDRLPRTRDLYSTVVIHSDKENDCPKRKEELQLDDDDDDSLPPLLKRLPKDFGGDGGSFTEYDHDSSSADTAGGNDFSTVIVKPSTLWFAVKPSLAGRDPSYSEFYNSGLKKPIESFDDDEEEDNGDFFTFVVKDMGKGRKEREDVSGTMARRTSESVVGGFRDSTLGRAVVSMKAAGELGSGIGKKGKGRGSSTSHGNDGGRRMSNRGGI